MRDHNFETVTPVMATFAISQTGGVDDLNDSDIGKAVTLTGNFEIGPTMDGKILLGKLIALTLSDCDNGDRIATVQIGGICRLHVLGIFPNIGERVIGALNGTIHKVSLNCNAGRGTVLELDGGGCTILLN